MLLLRKDTIVLCFIADCSCSVVFNR